MPVMRAMALAFPDDPASWRFEQQFLSGPSLLVAPITAPGGRVTAYLPRGRWHGLWNGESYEGGRTVDLDMKLDEIPVFGRDGHVLALGPVVQRTDELGPNPAIAELWAFGYEGSVRLAANTEPPIVRTWECSLASASVSEVVFKRLR